MLTDRERAELHVRLQEISQDAEAAAAHEAARLATALRPHARGQSQDPPLRMR